MLKILLLVLGTIFVIYLFWKRLTRARDQSIFIIFTFEVLLIMLFLNIDFWLDDPFCLRQILSWISLALSIVFVLSGVIAFKKFGQPIEELKGPHLITQGIFRFIRHPLYSSLIFLSVGILLKHIRISTLLLAAISIVLVTVTAVREEKSLKEKFGSIYDDYKKVTKRFIPFIF